MGPMQPVESQKRGGWLEALRARGQNPFELLITIITQWDCLYTQTAASKWLQKSFLAFDHIQKFLDFDWDQNSSQYLDPYWN